VTLNLFFKISQLLYGDIIKASIEIRRRFKAEWWVDDQRYFPHLSLYLFEAPVKNRSKIIETAKDFAAEINLFEVKVVGMNVSTNGLIMVDFEKNKVIYDYHLRALKLFNPLRGGRQRDKYQDPEYLASLPKLDREKILQYGHRWVLDKYQPHITISQVKDSDISKKVVEEYEGRFKGEKARAVALRLSQALFEPENKSLLLFDQPL
jgi:2'-5' RNA ligase